jgi:hypothetical protein
MRVGGTISFQVNGRIYNAKGDFDYDLGTPKRESVVGSDGVHGHTERPKAPYISGKVTDRGDMSATDFFNIVGATATLALANGKVVVMQDAFYAGDGTGNTGEGELDCRFEGSRAEEVR